jgi:hypothetical protein
MLADCGRVGKVVVMDADDFGLPVPATKENDDVHA